jgi:hypothetical protein
MSNPLSSPNSYIVKSAHAAAITGICFVPSSTTSRDTLNVVSSSNDQRVKEWSISLDTEGAGDGESEGANVQIRKVGDKFTSIADVGDLAVLRDGEEGATGKVLVVGNGMEVWGISRQIKALK